MTLWLGAGVLLVLMLGGWGLSLRLRDVSIVDVMWGPAFVVVAWIGFAVAGGGRRALLAGLVTVWGLRLGAHLNFLVWWGLYLASGAWWTVSGPLVMTALLTRASGKAHLERALRRRPGYEAYVRRTSGFVPLPPR